ncbi:MAG: hypothetical protein ACR2RF_18575 [Geminicoccaceae bacterium]
MLGVLITVGNQRKLEGKKHGERMRSIKREKLQELYEATEIYYDYQTRELIAHLVMAKNEKIFSHDKIGDDDLIVKVLMLSELWFPQLDDKASLLRGVARKIEKCCVEIRHNLLHGTPISKNEKIDELKSYADELNSTYALFLHSIVDLFRKNFP